MSLSTPPSKSPQGVYSRRSQGFRYGLVVLLAVVLLVYLVLIFGVIAPSGGLSWEQIAAYAALFVAAVPACAVALHRYKSNWFLFATCLLVLTAFGGAYATIVGGTGPLTLFPIVGAALLQLALWVASLRQKNESVWIWQAPTWH